VALVTPAAAGAATSAISGMGSSFNRTFPPYSVTVLTLSS
jgi:hypothetical protein